MNRILLALLCFFCVMANAQNQVVRRQGAKKESGVVTSKKTTATSSNRKKTTPAASKQTPQNRSSQASSKRRTESPVERVERLPVAARQQIEYQTFYVNGVPFEMARVAAGSFFMGATSEQQNPIGDEKPVHKVTLTRNYYIGKTEVTQALWKAVMGNNPSFFKGDDKPVEYVSRNDCQTFISRLNAATGMKFRLPTEAEWEFAARGGNNSNHYQYSGSNNSLDVAWCSDNSSGTTHDVATKQPNELGLYDMSGNVWEWCSDWYGDYGSNAQTDPAGPSSGHFRVGRGGSWYGRACNCRSSYRGNYDDCRYDFFGLRLALSESDAQRTESAEEIPIANSGSADVVDLEKANDREKPQSDLPQSVEVKTFVVKGVSFDMVKVEAGTFTMGATPEMKDPKEDEKPAHQVTLSKNYYLGKTEVTQALWKAIMKKDPSMFEGDNKPVEQVSWKDCQKFISKLNAATGKKFRLPTEAEWEFAARGGNKSNLYQYSGSNNVDDVAWYENNASDSLAPHSFEWFKKNRNSVQYGTHDVSTKQPNELGLYDMSGNVLEWCSDMCGDYSSNAQFDPVGPTSGAKRIIRGGCWSSSVGSCRSSARGFSAPSNFCSVSLGFRLALSE
jgi:formylglycine-generating enzyme required for sulfatase activity